MRMEVRTTRADKARWQALAESRGVSLSELVRLALDGQRPRQPSRACLRRAPPPVEPALLRELARIGNNLNQLARAANRAGPVPAAALLVRLIEIDRELAALRRAHERPADAGEAPGEAGEAASRSVPPPPGRAGPPEPASATRLSAAARLARCRRPGEP